MVIFLQLKILCLTREITFNDFFIKIKTEFARNGLDIPEDIELIELAHME